MSRRSISTIAAIPSSGKITPWAQSYVEQAQAIGAYVEVTVSGTGLRIIGIAEGAKAHRKFTKIGEGDCSIEVFRKAERYITISGLELGHSDALPNIDVLIDGVVKRYGKTDDKTDDKSDDFSGGDQLSEQDYRELLEHGTLKGKKVADRSVVFHRVVWHLAASGLPAKNIVEWLRRYPNGIAAKFMRPRNRLADEVKRSFEKFKNHIPAIIAKWNQTHAHVLAGGKSAVLQEFTTPEGYIDFKLLSSASFHEWNAEHTIVVGIDDKGKAHVDTGFGILAEASEAAQISGHRFLSRPRSAQGLLQSVARLRGRAATGRLLEISGAPARQHLSGRRRAL